MKCENFHPFDGNLLVATATTQDCLSWVNVTEHRKNKRKLATRVVFYIWKLEDING